MENALTKPRDYSQCDKTAKCPWIGCRYHLAMNLKVRKRPRDTMYKVRDLLEMGHTCALAAANEGPKDNDEVAELMGLHKEIARRLYNKALDKFRRAYARSTFDALSG